MTRRAVFKQADVERALRAVASVKLSGPDRRMK